MERCIVAPAALLRMAMLMFDQSGEPAATTAGRLERALGAHAITEARNYAEHLAKRGQAEAAQRWREIVAELDMQSTRRT